MIPGMSRPGRSLLRLAAYQLAFSLIGFTYWMADTFGPVTLDQVLWHLRYAEGAAVVMSEVFLVPFLVDVLLLPFVAALLAGAFHAFAAPRLAGRWVRVLRGAPALLVLASFGAVAVQLSAVSYAEAYLGPDRFARDYVNPSDVRMHHDARKRNLILIYAESMEAMYGDRALFGQDLMAPLHTLGGRSYGWYRPAAGATWTMGAMVATQCGVPLQVHTPVDVRQHPGEKSFLPGATCLGDVLRAEGYKNVFLGGVPLSFAGKGSFLRDHGYDETWGRDEWVGVGAKHEEFSGWGLWDSALFARSRDVLDRLHASGKPFNLTVLTVATHAPFGFVSPDCREQGVQPFQGATTFQGVVACNAGEIAAFVRYAKQRGYLEDTVVVVIGDHLAGINPVADRLDAARNPHRGMFNLFVGKDLPPANRDELLPFDMFPTMLELMGIHAPDGRLGLGYAAVGSVPQRPAEDSADAWAQAGLRNSALYDRLWSARAPQDAARDVVDDAD